MQLFGFLIVAIVIVNFGRCDTTCEVDRVGPNCQFKNIAYKKPSRHDSNIDRPLYSENANDDSLTTCSYTSDKKKAAPWWNLWLSEITTFKKLEFVTIDSRLSHFPNFEVTVYNTTESNFKLKGPVSGGQVCYNHNNYIPQSTNINVTCNGSPVGNLIRLQLHSKRFQLVLCDFRLYGDCFNGFYGSDCQKCSDNCESSKHQYCDSNNGHCPQGCKPGWEGDRCET
ncbi:uncharacterized protein LOC132753574, partial [Ruditapes philippinarum]|uniref:uncharacterized protein LOC132753574 n=1 Tax=Ruditapes philippinarum TaxID=129788 RepID=UPI00295B0DCD